MKTFENLIPNFWCTEKNNDIISPTLQEDITIL